MKHLLHRFHARLGLWMLLLFFIWKPSMVSGQALTWFSGKAVGYELQRKHAHVVDKAAEMFAADMLQATGRRAKASRGGVVAVYQLDQASGKELAALQQLKVPMMVIITHPDAFWIGIRAKRIIVVGSNGRGAAYGLLQLSRMAGVSPWAWWGDVVPPMQQRLDIGADFELQQVPSVDFRGIALDATAWSTEPWDHKRLDVQQGHDKTLGLNYYHQLFELLLRLHANFVTVDFEGDGEGYPKALKEMADSFGIMLGSRRGSHQLRLQEHKKNATIDIAFQDDGYGYMAPTGNGAKRKEGVGAVCHLSYHGWPHDWLWLSTTQPGLLCQQLRSAYQAGASRMWMAVIHDPKVAAYALNLMMDMAWQADAVKPDGVARHLQEWLSEQFGTTVAKALADPLRQYFRLTAIRKPELMDFSLQSTDGADGGVGNTQFSAEAFGDEVLRYLNDYRAVSGQVVKVRELVDPQLRPAYFAAVEYPVRAAALMAEKQLQAQEARLIGRAESFHHDEEALQSAALSVKAYRDLQALTAEYDQLCDGKWQGLMNDHPRGLAVFGKPVLPDTLSDHEVEQYGVEENETAPLSVGNCVVAQAADYRSASSGVAKLDLAGHSSQAVAMEQGDSVVYQFWSKSLGGVLRLAFLPTHALDGSTLQAQVSVDGGQPTTFTITRSPGTDGWAEQVLRGQAVVTLPVAFPTGNHTLCVKALSPGIIFDQWMADPQQDRDFYVFPLHSAK